MTKVAVTFSCDTNYFPLLKGLILSLAALKLPNDEISLHLADTGCTDRDLAWLAPYGVNVLRFDVGQDYRFSPATPDNTRYASLLYRPVAPTLFPGYDVYVHIDADIWIQHTSGLMDYITLCAQNPDKVLLSPCVDYSYISEYRKEAEHVGASYRMYNDVYGKAVAESYYGRPVLSAGMYAIHHSHPFWADWKREMDRSYDTVTRLECDRAASDQTTMNYLLHQSLAFIPLNATYNYNCHLGFPSRQHSTGRVVVGFPPNEPIKVIHLTCFRQLKATYNKFALLYDQGRYLSDEDRQTLGLP